MGAERGVHLDHPERLGGDRESPDLRSELLGGHRNILGEDGETSPHQRDTSQAGDEEESERTKHAAHGQNVRGAGGETPQVPGLRGAGEGVPERWARTLRG